MTQFETITSICEKYGVALMYLFGSCAQKAYDMLSGKPVIIADPLADIDIGVLFCHDLPPAQERYNLYAALNNKLADIFPQTQVDLSFLQENHSVFQVEAIKGICIYAVSKDLQEDYEEMVLRKAADFRPFLELFLNEILEEVV
jgi:predicted nucleotidyltransferase